MWAAILTPTNNTMKVLRCPDSKVHSARSRSPPPPLHASLDSSLFTTVDTTLPEGWTSGTDAASGVRFILSLLLYMLPPKKNFHTSCLCIHFTCPLHSTRRHLLLQCSNKRIDLGAPCWYLVILPHFLCPFLAFSQTCRNPICPPVMFRRHCSSV
jgi:hypothetical protein